MHERRGTAVALVLMSGIMILCLSLVLQVLAWEIRPLLQARFGWDERDFPTLTRGFVECFGYRPDGNLGAVVLWLYWPMVCVLARCHYRYPNPEEFSRAFLFWFVCCWLFVACCIVLILAVCALSFVILLAELRSLPPPGVMSLVHPISWVLPFSVAVFVGWEWCRSRWVK